MSDEIITVNKKALKELLDFFYDVITDVSDESAKFYKEFSKEYDTLLHNLLGD